MTKDEVVEWHHLLNVHESEQTLGDGEVQESLVLLQFMALQRVGHDLRLNKSNSNLIAELQVAWRAERICKAPGCVCCSRS